MQLLYDTYYAETVDALKTIRFVIELLFCVVLSRPLEVIHTPCLKKKTVRTFFCQYFVKFRPIVKIFRTKIAKRTSFSGVYSFSTSPNLCHCSTLLNADVPNAT